MELVFSSGGKSYEEVIVGLLKQSLGEALLPKSTAFWTWKHIDNPFGESPTVLAFENNELIAVRSFLQWRWSNGSNTLKALRAVDTSVSPKHQGKGIFSKLTMELVRHCEAQGYDLIYNTPNSKSMPGYLKMGWISAGRMQIGIRPRPLAAVGNFLSLTTATDQCSGAEAVLNDPAITGLLAQIKQEGSYKTPVDANYLRWRYARVPGIKYFAWRNADCSMLVFFRLKDGSKHRELRITDCISLLKGSEFRRGIRQFLSHHSRTRPSFLSLADTQDNNGFFKFDKGPHVTLREVRQKFDLNQFRERWNPSLGDMELF